VNHLVYGDNPGGGRNPIGDETVDLICLDPPFHSNGSDDVLFKSPTGDQPAAQIEAFDGLCSTNLARDSSCESSVAAGLQEQTAPPSDKTRNWASDNRVLKFRGSRAIWFDPAMTRDAVPNGKRGRRFDHGDAAFRTCLTMKVLFGMALSDPALAAGRPLPDQAWRLYRIRFAPGWPAFGALVAVFWLMVSRPDF
jgi:hypothetical protein